MDASVAPLTVMQVLPALDAGGVERGTLEIAAALRRAGHRALVVSAGGRLVPELESLGARHFSLKVGSKSPMTLLRSGRLADLMDGHEVDVVHARSRMPAWVVLRALKSSLRRPAFVTTLHGLNSVNRYSAIMTRADRMIAVSEACRDYWLKHYPTLDPARIRVIHRGIDPAGFPRGHHPGQEWERAFRRELGIPEQAPLMCLPGRITRLKGHAALIRLLAGTSNERPAPHAVVVGDYSGRSAYVKEIEGAARRHQVQERLHWAGHRSDVRDIFSVSDLVLSLSSRPESFGRTVAEALSLGRPVAGWNHGGVGEILSNWYPPGCVTTGDDEGLLERVRALLKSPVPVPDTQPYGLDRMQQQTLALYEELAMAQRERRAASS